MMMIARADHGIYGGGQAAASDEAADQGTEDQAIGRVHLADDEYNGDRQADQST